MGFHVNTSTGAGKLQVEFSDETRRCKDAELAIYGHVASNSLMQLKQPNLARVRCQPKAAGGKAWHAGGTDPTAPVHITVEFAYLDPKTREMQHISTHHIQAPEGFKPKEPLKPHESNSNWRRRAGEVQPHLSRTNWRYP